jgi:hypothetical protein
MAAQAEGCYQQPVVQFGKCCTAVHSCHQQAIVVAITSRLLLLLLLLLLLCVVAT